MGKITVLKVIIANALLSIHENWHIYIALPPSLFDNRHVAVNSLVTSSDYENTQGWLKTLMDISFQVLFCKKFYIIIYT